MHALGLIRKILVIQFLSYELYYGYSKEDYFNMTITKDKVRRSFYYYLNFTMYIYNKEYYFNISISKKSLKSVRMIIHIWIKKVDDFLNLELYNVKSKDGFRNRNHPVLFTVQFLIASKIWWDFSLYTTVRM